jgi:hypothetical protein
MFHKGLVSRGQRRENGVTQITPFMEIRTMEGWEKEVESLLRGELQQREDRSSKAQQEREAKEENRKKAIAFIQGVALRALKTLENGLQKQNLVARVRIGDDGTSIAIAVERQGERTKETKRFEYVICAIYTASEVTTKVVDISKPLVRSTHISDAGIQREGRTLSIDEITENDIIKDFMEAFSSTFGK